MTEAILLASAMRPQDGGPRFRVEEGGKWISDEDFIFDAVLRIDGDFLPEQRAKYAQWVADALNAADEKLPQRPRPKHSCDDPLCAVCGNPWAAP